MFNQLNVRRNRMHVDNLFTLLCVVCAGKVNKEKHHDGRGMTAQNVNISPLGAPLLKLFL